MSIADDIIASRDCGVVHCGLSSQKHPSVAELAMEFGLAGDPTLYSEIGADSARRIVEYVLNQDLAYGGQIVPAARATKLADQFLAQFGADGVRFYTNGLRFYTNGSLHEMQGSEAWSSASWNPVTSATFDTGVLAIGPRCSGCLWVEDED